VKLTRQQRGYTNDWYRLVAKAKERQPFCSVCGHTGSPDNPLTGDHILAKARGGANILENIDIKCRSCNSRKGKRLS
jgi:5-methylcytosine-specific restriction protein A